ncbi:MAG TPA: glycosyltransferase family 4 protein [Candidatus Nitrosotenuis sp.]|nr:glycosyltransferase family 4 protein [Candidatus Nitrosotenuis sp.]
MMIQKRKKILFISNSLADMIKCRGHIMSRIAKEGHKVFLIAPDDNQIAPSHELEMITQYNWFLRSKNHNPFLEVLSFFHLLWLLIVIKPDLVFSYTVKPNLYISFLRKFFKFNNCSIVTGLGRIFTIRNPFYLVMRKIVFCSFKSANQVWVMNRFDYLYLKQIKSHSVVRHMPGEGVDIEKFAPQQKSFNAPEAESRSLPKFLFIGRLLKSKGLEELMQATKILSERGLKVPLTVIGPYDAKDPDKIDKHQFDALVKQGLINYLGVIDDVRQAISQCDCLILPSYREGLPRVILEASAMERPVITTKVPGCQDLVKDGMTGFLIPSHSSKSLANAIEKFLKLSEEKRRQLGIEGRKFIKSHFTINHVQNFYLGALENLVQS